MGMRPPDVLGESATTTDARPARVVLVDDHQVVRSGLKTLIDFESDLVVTGEAETAAEAIRLVEADPPDLVVMDARLPDRSGISACLEITTLFPEVKVMILTSHIDTVVVSSALAASASGYVLRSARASDLVTDMRRILDGDRLFDQVETRAALAPLFSALSPQEKALASHLCEGLTQIADRMELAEKTVKNYVSNVLLKLGMKRRSEVAAYMARIEAMADSSLVDGSDPHRRGKNLKWQ